MYTYMNYLPRLFQVPNKLSIPSPPHSTPPDFQIWGWTIHRRRIELEEKAKIVASDWGTESLPRCCSCFASVYLKQLVEFNRLPEFLAGFQMLLRLFKL